MNGKKFKFLGLIMKFIKSCYGNYPGVLYNIISIDRSCDCQFSDDCLKITFETVRMKYGIFNWGFLEYLEYKYGCESKCIKQK